MNIWMINNSIIISAYIPLMLGWVPQVWDPGVRMLGSDVIKITELLCDRRKKKATYIDNGGM